MASELKANEPNVAVWRETVTDLTAGAAGGAAQVLIGEYHLLYNSYGQPFDLVKVRLQTQNGGNTLPTARNIWAKEGPLAFYRGTLMPLLGVGACVSIQFGAFHGIRQAIESYNTDKRPGHDSTLSIPQYYLAGAGAGVATSIISVQIYNGPLGCALKLIGTAGIAGIYRGQAVTLLREIHGYGVWLAAYEGLVGIAMARQQKEREELPS
ncbi:mitochondrial carrier protein ymc [Aspergillus flavus]|nr:mitochondrial carrier protein ymc [Aspergillus flavus]